MTAPELDILDRTPPSNAQFETNIVGAVMLKASVLDEVTGIGLVGADFYHPHTAAAWVAINVLASRGEPYDALSVNQEMLRTGTHRALPDPGWLATTQFAAIIPAVPHHARKVRDFAAKRRAILAGAKIYQAAWSTELDATDVQALAEAEVERIGSPVDETTWSPIDEVMGLVSDRYEETVRHGGMDGIRWGYIDVDKRMTPMQPGDLAVVVAWAGGGKSLVAANLALDCAVKYGIPSLVHAIEMTRLELGQRYAAKTAEVRLDRIIAGELTYAERTSFDQALGKVCGAPLIVDESPTVNLSQLRASIRKHKPKLVIVDQIPIMRVDDEKPSREQQLTKLTYDLKELAKRERIVIVACAQMNSEPSKRSEKIPTLQDIRESRGIGQAASIVVFLHDPTGGEAEHVRSGEVDWWVRKQRMGPKDFAVPLAQQFHYARLENLSRVTR